MHIADKHLPKEKSLSLEDQIKKINKKPKKTLLTYKKIANNKIFAKKVRVLPETRGGLIDANGKSYEAYEQEVFVVLMTGDITDDYAAFSKEELTPGTKILMTEAHPFVHNEHCSATNSDLVDLTGFYVVEARKVMAIVEYDKI